MASSVERILKLTGQGAALAVVAAMLGVLVWRLTHQSRPPKTGTAAPLFSAALLIGPGELKLASLRGKAVVINFFQSSCVPCKAESKALEMAYQQYRHKGVVVLGVDFQDAVGDARRFVRAHGITYPVVRDGGDLASNYAIIGTPETFLVDRRGRLVETPIVGSIVNQADEFRRAVEAAIHS